MLDLTGEIAIACNLRRMLEEVGGDTEVLEAQGEVDRLCQDLQERVMQARLVPLGATLRQHIRTVRDLAAAQGKQARLVIEGEDVEVDTSVIEHVRDPLTHMVRNAVDHGIEAPEERRRRGKDACGTIALRARHESGTIVLEISDDGAGLDRERILERARHRGLDTARLDAGRSSAWSSSRASRPRKRHGSLRPRRGLDVVRHALRGSVGVPAARRGTAIAVRLPSPSPSSRVSRLGGTGPRHPLGGGGMPRLPGEASEDGTARRDQPARSRPALREAAPAVRRREARREHVVVRRDDGAQAGLVVGDLHGESQPSSSPSDASSGACGIAGSAILQRTRGPDPRRTRPAHPSPGGRTGATTAAIRRTEGSV
jgi:two-component system chemotaxis sensor kinase CheA